MASEFLPPHLPADRFKTFKQVSPRSEKFCKRCDAVTEHRRRGKRQYIYCVPCRQRIGRAYCERNRVKLRKKFREWYADPIHKAAKNAQSLGWHKTHLARSREITRAWRLRKKLEANVER